MKEYRVDIRPGGMLSDKVPNELGATQHQTVKNLRQNKLGQWQAVSPYANLKTGLSSVKAAIEVTEDRTDERFILFQSGTSLYRLDYSAGYAGTPTLLTLPSGVTIGASATLRFFYHAGVVRITGASEPMWYGYIDRTLFEDSGDDIVLADWVLEKAAVSNSALTIALSDQLPYRTSASASGSGDRYWFLKVFFVFDDGQYSLLTTPSIGTPELVAFSPRSALPSDLFLTNDGTDAMKAYFTISGTGLKTAFPNKRVTGIGFCLAISSTIQSTEDNLDWRVAHVEDFGRPIDDLAFHHNDLKYVGADANKLYVEAGNSVLEQGFISVGDTIIFTNDNGTVTTTVSAIGVSGSDRVYTFDDAITDLVTSVGVDENPIPGTAITLTRQWDYGAVTGYSIYVALAAGVGLTYEEFTGTPVNSEDITPDYRHHQVIAGIAYVDPQTAGEEDFVRYSPTSQYDVFPIGNTFGTQIGDTDRIKAMIERDGRLIILKGNSGSQGNWSGSQFYKDVGFLERGLYGEFGLLVVDNVLYWIARDDVYAYGGGPQPLGLLSNHGLRQYYLSNVDTSTFLAWDKLNSELLIIFGTTMLAYHPERQEWFRRETDFTPVAAFTDQDERLLMFSASKLVNFNGSAGLDETVTWQVLTRVIDDKQRGDLKKLIQINAAMLAKNSVTITWSDDISATSGNEAITPSSALVTDNEVRPKYLHKQLEIQLDGNGECTIEEIYATIGAWKR
ncbi:MAG: hypothetical protein KDI38_03625 [Calditrichaeota bacterium]|nr:hypothetical protein [Calditrichota bacterium]